MTRRKGYVPSGEPHRRCPYCNAYQTERKIAYCEFGILRLRLLGYRTIAEVERLCAKAYRKLGLYGMGEVKPEHMQALHAELDDKILVPSVDVLTEVVELDPRRARL